MKNFSKNSIITGYIILCCVSGVFAQTSISGKVTDGVSGDPLAGVNIIVKGRVLGTITDTQGSFSLTVNDSPPLTLVFSFVGYRSQEIDITNPNTSGIE